MGRKSAKRIVRPVRELLEVQVKPNPIEQLRGWVREAEKAKVIEPTAMVLATATADARPSARVVLLKTLDQRGLVFFTNYESRKATELEANAHAALVFFWASLGRQVRVEGRIARVSREETETYFVTRPRMSRIGAWASHQSQILPDRMVLDRSVAEFEERFRGKEIPAPPHWGGYRLVPSVFEFWQSRENRLHDRLRYSRTADSWSIERLSP